MLTGQKGSSYYYNYGHQMSITFKLPGFAPQSYTGLIALNDSVINLQNQVSQVRITTDSTSYDINVISGILHFKKAKNLFVDKNQEEVIFSGYFELKFILNDEPVTISNGRFDVGIGTNNFYNY